MTNEEQDFMILRAGYNTAINEIIPLIDDDVLKDKILRKQRAYLIGNTIYDGFLYKYYDEQNQLGYILFDDIYELKGVCIFIKEGNYAEIDESELIFARQNYKLIYSEQFNNKDLINLRYYELLEKYKKADI